MDITTVVGCSVGCVYCPQKETVKSFKKIDNNPSKLLTLETFKTCLSKIPSNIQINFAGYSEPFLNPYTTEMIISSVDKGHQTTLFTTLRGIKNTDIDQLSELDLKAVEIHLPSKDGKQKVDYGNSYIDKLDKISNRLTNVSFILIDLKEKAKTFDEINSIIENKRIYHEPANSRAGMLNELIVSSPKPYTGEIMCDRGLNSNVLLPNGDVTVCCQDFGAKHVIGNLLIDEYEDLFKSSEFQKVSQGLKNTNSKTLCRTCEYAIELNE